MMSSAASTAASIQAFQDIVRMLIEYHGTENRAGHRHVLLGNVEFWIDGNDLVYSLPSPQWDAAAIGSAVARILAPQPSAAYSALNHEAADARVCERGMVDRPMSL
jgi:hypothetical protein